MRANSPKQGFTALWYPMAGVAFATVGDGGRYILRPSTWFQVVMTSHSAGQEGRCSFLLLFLF